MAKRLELCFFGLFPFVHSFPSLIKLILRLKIFHKHTRTHKSKWKTWGTKDYRVPLHYISFYSVSNCATLANNVPTNSSVLSFIFGCLITTHPLDSISNNISSGKQLYYTLLLYMLMTLCCFIIVVIT